MKRKDVKTNQVLAACKLFHNDVWKHKTPDEIIMDETNAPYKVVMAAMKREHDKGNLDYGVSLATAWVTDKGDKLLTELATH